MRNRSRLVWLLTGIGFLVAGTPARPQSPASSCKDGAAASASLLITLAKIHPPTQAGLIVRVFPAAQQFREGQNDYRLVGSGQTAEFAGLCPGQYVVTVHGNGFGLCGYATKRKISLHKNEARQVKLEVNWKKGSVCE